MRSLIVIIILFASSLTLAQDEYHDDEFGFTVNASAGWQISTEDQWTDKTKTFLKNYYVNKTILMINPLGIEPLKNPCIQIQGKILDRTTTSEAIGHLKDKGEEVMLKYTRYVAEDFLGKKLKEYSEIDEFYDYDSKRSLAIAKVVYKNNKNDTYALTAMAKAIGLQRVIDFRAYWKGENPEDFWQVLTEVINSFNFDTDTIPKRGLGKIARDIKEVDNLSKVEKVSRIWEWAGIILTISIVLYFIKKLFFK